MKKLLFNMLVASLTIATVSCNNRQGSNVADSSEAVQKSPGDNADPKDTTAAKQDSTQKNSDEDFALQAAAGGMMEVELGRLAQNKGIAPKVMHLANMMVTDHTKANNELKTIAAAKGIKLPTLLDKDHQKDYDELSKMERKDFDKAYTEYMVKDHKEDIEKFKKEAESGKDPELKAFASKHVPILEHHLKMSQETKTVADAKK